MVERSVKSEHGVDLFLPPGFRFHPTDEEVITSYLLQKFLNPSFAPHAIGEVDLNKCEPWDLPSKAKMGEKEWYFFCHKDMKYPTGTRANRATKEGYWKATGKDREIFKQPGRELVGMKKTLVFYMGRAPRGTKTNWVMHEFRLEGKSRHTNDSLRFNPKDEWVVCKVHHKGGEEGSSTKKAAAGEENYSSAGTPNVSSVEAVEGDEFLVDSLLDYSSYFNSSLPLPPSTTTTISAAAPPYNADLYPVHTTTTIANAGLTTTTSTCFVGLPTDASNSQHVAAVANSAATATNNHDSSSWNMLRHAPDQQAMGTNYSLHHQAMVAKALGGGGVTSPNFAAGLPSSSVAAAGRIAQHNSQNVLLQQRLAWNYGGNYAAGYHTSK
ncbi:unnamed protein product [Miscanthus lutarioriparius]|uniref:NAC domain-containing protein n=1 Tax=Miscanthus lutarioriparius TaxID=422564 RepID=A0A811QHV0_9POAL|nr:unnamed protein product [Miscanthus lutarioriparius]